MIYNKIANCGYYYSVTTLWTGGGAINFSSTGVRHFVARLEHIPVSLLLSDDIPKEMQGTLWNIYNILVLPIVSYKSHLSWWVLVQPMGNDLMEHGLWHCHKQLIGCDAPTMFYITKRNVRWYYGFSIACSPASPISSAHRPRRCEHLAKQYSTDLFQIWYVVRYPSEVHFYWNLILF